MDIIRKEPQHGWIEVIAGSMFSGKSEELIRRLRRVQIARQKVQIFKPTFDDRYSDDHIVSHSDMRIASANVGCIQHLQGGTGIPVRHWIEIEADEAKYRAFIDQHIFGVRDFTEYLQLCGGLPRLQKLRQEELLLNRGK